MEYNCKNCGGDFYLHRKKDMRCPKDGEYQSTWKINKKEPWKEVPENELWEETTFEAIPVTRKATKDEFRSALLSIYDSLKLADNDSLDLTDETLTEIMFRKMKAYNIDLNKELGFTHLKPVEKK